MRILQLHNRYQIVGGEEGVVQAERSLLQQQGHFVECLEVSNDGIQGLGGKAIATANAIYSFSARQQVLKKIDQFQADLVHVHNFFPLLSPSVYDACRDRQIPVIQTLHNYRLICPKAMLFRDNQVCELCVGQSFPLAGVKYGCYRGSKAQTAVVSAMLSWHHLRGTWQNRVNTYIALTEFQKQKLVEGGLPSDRIQVKPNFTFVPDFPDLPRQSFILFVGRLAEEKGILQLLEAYRLNPQLPLLKIAGDGPLRPVLDQFIEQHHLHHRVQLLGRQPKETIFELMQAAICLVFPSIWYEGFPLTIVEAFACGLPVIVPSLGSMAEIVENGQTGLHFQAQNSQDLADKITWMSQHRAEVSSMSEKAQHRYHQSYTPQANYDRLMAIYQSSFTSK
ncbi:MAG: glycosyltransferase [Synechococcales bacterium]|nr:glycosyltransferase [Synechococcales bacterium]